METGVGDEFFAASDAVSRILDRLVVVLCLWAITEGDVVAAGPHPGMHFALAVAAEVGVALAFSKASKAVKDGINPRTFWICTKDFLSFLEVYLTCYAGQIAYAWCFVGQHGPGFSGFVRAIYIAFVLAFVSVMFKRVFRK